MPVTTLKNVVLPDPFGPIRPRISFDATARSRPSSATTPPKRRTRPCTSSSVVMAAIPKNSGARGAAANRPAETTERQSPATRTARTGILGSSAAFPERPRLYRRGRSGKAADDPRIPVLAVRVAGDWRSVVSAGRFAAAPRAPLFFGMAAMTTLLEVHGLV